jgi:hypothetical protein
MGEETLVTSAPPSHIKKESFGDGVFFGEPSAGALVNCATNGIITDTAYGAPTASSLYVAQDSDGVMQYTNHNSAQPTTGLLQGTTNLDLYCSQDGTKVDMTGMEDYTDKPQLHHVPSLSTTCTSDSFHTNDSYHTIDSSELSAYDHLNAATTGECPQEFDWNAYPWSTRTDPTSP